MESEKTNFDRYSADLDKAAIEQKSRSELKALQKAAVAGDKDAWLELWLYGTKLVLRIVNTMRRRGLLTMSYEDAVAEGNLAIGNALLSWNPHKGAFSTWVWIRIRGSILNENVKHMKDFFVGPAEESPWVVTELEHESAVDDVVELAEEGQTPDDAEQARLISELYLAIEQLPVREADYITRVYLMEVPQETLALAEGVSARMVRKVISRGLERLRAMLGADELEQGS
jgi:RNA polymerase sigma factor (sigma-70 family)